MRSIKATIGMINRFFDRLQKDRVFEWAAQFSFYLILAFFPFVVLLTILASRTVLVGDQAILQLSTVLPKEAFETVVSTIRDITMTRKPGLLSASMVVALWAASSGVFALSKGLNMAHKAEETRKLWLVRLLSLLFTLLIIISIFTEILMIVLGDFILDKMAHLFEISAPFITLGRILRVIVPVGVVFLILALMYFVIPNHRLRFKKVLPGALFSTILWMGTSWLFSLYVARFGQYSVYYGSLGGVIILMIWIYISSITLIMGSEVNALVERLSTIRKKKMEASNSLKA